MDQWTGVILAAGQGTRMKSSLPKVLHTVCGKTLLGHVIAIMESAGADRIVTVVNPSMAEMPEFREAAGDDAVIAIQDEALGTAHALECARQAVGPVKSMVVGAGDMALIQPDSVKRLVDTHASSTALLSVLTADVADPAGLGRIIRSGDQSVSAIVEEAEADPAQKQISEINTGWYCLEPGWTWSALDNVRVSTVGEKYLTDLVSKAVAEGRAATTAVTEPSEALGINTRIQLAEVEAAMRGRIRRHHMLSGVTMRDPSTTYIDAGVEIGRDTELLPGNHILTGTKIGEGCVIGPNSILKNCVIGDRARIVSSHIEQAEVGADTSVGPFSRVRAGTMIARGVYIGNFAEIKDSKIGTGTHIGHFSYVGDSDLGEDVNIGAGTVTANFDGKDKHATVIGDRVKIGSDTVIVAPVKVGDDASTGAGAVVNRDVAPGETVVGVPARPIKKRPVGGTD